MAKRLFDLLLSATALIVTAPLLLFIAVAIKLSDPGPVFYHALRQGAGDSRFPLYKFRTMRVGADKNGAITGVNDARVFALGNFLRHTKLDEVPQFWNVLKGDMSVVGPRPEDIDIVDRCYTDSQRRTLSVRPGIASPGSIFNYTHAGEYLDDNDVAGSYETHLLPVKLGLELVYIDDVSFAYDLRIITRTLLIVIRMLLGQRQFALPPEYAVAEAKGYFSA
jgi:lipopolysaccharide/colanic/teichoic acid biosynthesis glycosyltransferase